MAKYRSKRGSKRRSRRSSKSSSKVMRKVALSVVKGMAEHKYSDFQWLAQTFNFPGSVFQLCDIAVGDADQQRNGDQITPLSLEVRIVQNNNDSTNTMRCIIFRWKPNYGIHVPVTADILQYTATLAAPMSPLLVDGRAQFEVLLDHTFYGTGYSGTSTALTNYILAGSNNINFLHKNIKLNPKKKIQYFSGSAVNCTNGIYIMYVSDSGASPYPFITGYTRLRYMDG